MNIIEPILYQCKRNPFITAIATPGSGLGSVKYGQLEELIHNVARSAIKAGMAPGDTVGLFLSDPIVHAALCLGMMRIGIVTVSLGEATLPEHVKLDAVLTDAPQRFPDASNVVAANAAWLQGEGTALDYERIYRCNEDDDCRIILTSGSTGRRKGVAFSHKAMEERVAHYRYKGRRFVRLKRLYSGFGIASSPGFRLMLHMLSQGGTVYYDGLEPGGILQYLEAFGVDGYACSPHQLDRTLRFFEEDDRLSSRFDLIVCQGARLAPQLVARARARLCQEIYTSYGSTETTTVASGPVQLAEKQPGTVGVICPGVAVEIVGADGRLLAPGQTGEIWIRSPQVAKGYINDPEATAQMFRDGKFRSGDSGFVTADHLLVVTGRVKTALLVSGETIAPELIEDVLCGFAGITEAAVCTVESADGISDVHALVVGNPNIDERGLFAYFENRLRPSFFPARFVWVEAIPRGGQGKIDRVKVQDIAKAAATKHTAATS